MAPLIESEKKELIRLISTGETLPEQWKYRLFPGTARGQETGKEYRLAYDGKMKREEVLAMTPAAPWQLVRQFCADRPHAGGWNNLLANLIRLLWQELPIMNLSASIHLLTATAGRRALSQR